MSQFFSKLGFIHDRLWDRNGTYRLALLFGPGPLIGCGVAAGIWFTVQALPPLFPVQPPEWAKIPHPIDRGNTTGEAQAQKTPPARPRPPIDAHVHFGDIFENNLPFAGRTIPLPAGAWRVVASLPSVNPAGLSIAMTALASESGGKLSGLILLMGNDRATPNPIGFRADGNCERSDVIFSNIIANEDFGTQDCQYIDFLAPQDAERTGGDALLRAALGDLKERHIAVPGTLVGPAFRFGSHADLLIARIYFNPETDGIAPSAKLTWLDNDWNKYNLFKQPDKKRYVERLKKWLPTWESVLQDAWNGKPVASINDRDRLLPN